MFLFSFARKLSARLFLFVSVFAPAYKVFAADAYYIHPDHLGGAGVITDQNGQIDELLDYNSFGAVRLDQQMGRHNEKRKYIGQELDEETGLQYLNARYYDPALGRFISQDPQFWNLPESSLIDPQQQNSYSYARNNPIVLSDPLGLSSATYNPIPSGGWRFGQLMGSFKGVNAYYNGIGSGSMTYSCVEFAKRYQSQIFGITNIGPVGDARAMWNNIDVINERLSASKSQYTFTKTQNGSNSLPGEGDLLFWTEGKYGHVMVVTESAFDNATGKGHVEIIDQNASKQAVRSLAVEKSDHGYSIVKNNGQPVAGWFSPVKKNISVSSNNSAPAAQKQPSFFQRIWNNTKQFFKKNF